MQREKIRRNSCPSLQQLLHGGCLAELDCFGAASIMAVQFEMQWFQWYTAQLQPSILFHSFSHLSVCLPVRTHVKRHGILKNSKDTSPELWELTKEHHQVKLDQKHSFTNHLWTLLLFEYTHTGNIRISDASLKHKLT